MLIPVFEKLSQALGLPASSPASIKPAISGVNHASLILKPSSPVQSILVSADKVDASGQAIPRKKVKILKAKHIKLIKLVIVTTLATVTTIGLSILAGYMIGKSNGGDDKIPDDDGLDPIPARPKQDILSDQAKTAMLLTCGGMCIGVLIHIRT